MLNKQVTVRVACNRRIASKIGGRGLDDFRLIIGLYRQKEPVESVL